MSDDAVNALVGALAKSGGRPVVGACQFDTLLREHVVILDTPDDWEPDEVAVRIVGRGPDSFWRARLRHLDGINYDLPDEPLPCAACGGAFPTSAARGQIVCETGHAFAIVGDRLVSLDPGVSLDPDVMERYQQRFTEMFGDLLGDH